MSEAILEYDLYLRTYDVARPYSVIIFNRLPENKTSSCVDTPALLKNSRTGFWKNVGVERPSTFDSSKDRLLPAMHAVSRY